MDSDETCPECNVKLEQASYSGDPNLYYCPSCEDEFL